MSSTAPLRLSLLALAALAVLVALGTTPFSEALSDDGRAREGGLPAVPTGSGPVLPATREPGVPTYTHLRHDSEVLVVAVAPTRPGANLVRIDVAGSDRHTVRPTFVGTSASPSLVRATPRAGTDGLWAVVDLPRGSGTLVVTHGRLHRVPVPISTGTRRVDTSLWTGPAGPECLAAATAELLAARDGTGVCPAAAPSARLSRAAGTRLLRDPLLDAERRAYADALDTYVPGHSPTATGFAAWLARRGLAPTTR